MSQIDPLLSTVLQSCARKGSRMAILRSITAAAACAATLVDAAALLPRDNSTQKLVTSVSLSLVTPILS